MKEAPYPKKIPKKLYAHNDERIDNYYQLRDDKRKDKNVISYLVKENNFTNSWFKSNNVNSSKIFNYYKNAIPDFEESFKSQIDELLDDNKRMNYMRGKINLFYSKYIKNDVLYKKGIYDSYWTGWLNFYGAKIYNVYYGCSADMSLLSKQLLV